jgi:hypothetical protein
MMQGGLFNVNTIPNLRGNKIKEKKTVNVGVAGQTPKKIITFSERKVDVGTDGQTPKKYFHYDRFAAPKSSPVNKSNANVDDDDIQRFSPRGPMESPSDRPKTSRGKAHPSPDEFFDYVVPSPVQAKADKSKPKVVVFDAEANVHRAPTPSSEIDDINDAQKRDQIRMLGCWLFGSALRV